MSQSKRITIFDTTLRDGEQAPGCSMNIDEKLRIATQLEKLNVDVIEAGFPIASEGDFEAVKKIAQMIKGPQTVSFQCHGYRSGLGGAEICRRAGENSYLHCHQRYSYEVQVEDERRAGD